MMMMTTTTTAMLTTAWFLTDVNTSIERSDSGLLCKFDVFFRQENNEFKYYESYRITECMLSLKQSNFQQNKRRSKLIIQYQ